jgi:hypothetical protein
MTPLRYALAKNLTDLGNVNDARAVKAHEFRRIELRWPVWGMTRGSTPVLRKQHAAPSRDLQRLLQF